MGDSAAADAGKRFLKEFGADYKAKSGFDREKTYGVVEHGLVYDDFHREVRYGLTLRRRGTLSPGPDAEVILDEPAAYDPEVGDPADEIDRVARDLDLTRAEVLVRFKRAGLVDEGFSLADFTLPNREEG